MAILPLPGKDFWNDVIFTVTGNDIRVVDGRTGEEFNIPEGTKLYLTELEHHIVMATPNPKIAKSIPYVDWEEII